MSRITNTVSEFKGFILRGNVIDLAVAVVVGAAFGSVVTALVTDIITPIISIPGKANFADWVIELGGGRFLLGAFLNSVISFLSIAFAVFFIVVKPINALMSLRKSDTPNAPITRDCPYCLSSIPCMATRCAFCTANVEALSSLAL